MKVEIASKFYNASGIQEDNLPFSKRSEMLIDRIRNECESLIFDGAKTLEIGCGNGMEGTVLLLKKWEQSLQELIVLMRSMILPRNLLKELAAKQGLFVMMCQKIRMILKNGGVFCIAMNDCYIHNNGKKFEIDDYNAETGLKISRYTIPEKGTYEYHSYFWTVSMAKFICSKQFNNCGLPIIFRPKDYRLR